MSWPCLGDRRRTHGVNFRGRVDPGRRMMVMFNSVVPSDFRLGAVDARKA